MYKQSNLQTDSSMGTICNLDFCKVYDLTVIIEGLTNLNYI